MLPECTPARKSQCSAKPLRSHLRPRSRTDLARLPANLRSTGAEVLNLISDHLRGAEVRSSHCESSFHKFFSCLMSSCPRNSRKIKKVTNSERSEGPMHRACVIRSLHFLCDAR